MNAGHDDDALAIMLLCSRVGIPRDSGVLPLSGSEWKDVAPRIRDSALRRPGALLGTDTATLSAELHLELEVVERLVTLLSRGGQFAIELEQLESRGIWALVRSEDGYPGRLRDRLGLSAPAVLFGVGPPEALAASGIAVVGSRNASEDALDFVSQVGGAAVRAGLSVISGGARGVDAAAMRAANEQGGRAVGVLADSLERVVRQRDVRGAIAEGRSALVTPFHPATPFSVGNAMARNRLIYCLSEAAVVVQAALEGGGTRAGALENLRAGWVPLYVRDDGSSGNLDLIERGGAALPRYLDPEFDARALVHAAVSEEISLADRVLLEVWPVLTDGLQELTPAGVAERCEVSSQQSRSWLERAVELGLARRPGRSLRFTVLRASQLGESAGDGPPDLFVRIWPVLHEMLDQPRSTADVADAAGLRKPLAKKLLDRSVAASLAVRRTSPVRYELAAQSPLFEKEAT